MCPGEIFPELYTPAAEDEGGTDAAEEAPDPEECEPAAAPAPRPAQAALPAQPPADSAGAVDAALPSLDAHYYRWVLACLAQWSCGHAPGERESHCSSEEASNTAGIMKY